MNKRLKDYRVWWKCVDCDRVYNTRLTVGRAHRVPTFEFPEQPCSAPGRSGQFCRVEQKGDFEHCTGLMSDETLIFAGDRVGNDKVWAEVAWRIERGQWWVGDEPLWLVLERGAKVLGSSHEPGQTAKTTGRPHE